VCVVGANNFAVGIVPPVDLEIFHPYHQHLIMEHGIYLQEGMQSIVDYETYLPPVDPAFNNNCRPGRTVDGTNKTRECSCTQSAGPSKGYYWSSSTYAPSPIVQPPGSKLAWSVLFHAIRRAVATSRGQRLWTRQL
jgi:hypothetical protein